MVRFWLEFWIIHEIKISLLVSAGLTGLSSPSRTALTRRFKPRTFIKIVWLQVEDLVILLINLTISIWQWFVFCVLNSIIRLNVCLMKLRTLEQGKDHKLVLNILKSNYKIENTVLFLCKNILVMAIQYFYKIFLVYIVV